MGFDTVLAMKVAVTCVIGVLAVLQLLGALWLYGRLGVAAPSWLGTVHRVGGTVALLLTVFVGITASGRSGWRAATCPTARRCRCGRSCTGSSGVRCSGRSW